MSEGTRGECRADDFRGIDGGGSLAPDGPVISSNDDTLPLFGFFAGGRGRGYSSSSVSELSATGKFNGKGCFPESSDRDPISIFGITGGVTVVPVIVVVGGNRSPGDARSSSYIESSFSSSTIRTLGSTTNGDRTSSPLPAELGLESS